MEPDYDKHEKPICDQSLPSVNQTNIHIYIYLDKKYLHLNTTSLCWASSAFSLLLSSALEKHLQQKGCFFSPTTSSSHSGPGAGSASFAILAPKRKRETAFLNLKKRTEMGSRISTPLGSSRLKGRMVWLRHDVATEYSLKKIISTFLS